jgi:DNA invertase Pin-like site-specific DNA recombinase
LPRSPRLRRRRSAIETKAGMARAKAKGKRIGRPAVNLKLRQEIAGRVATGSSAYRAAKDLGLDRKSVAKCAATILKGQQERTIPRCQR